MFIIEWCATTRSKKASFNLNFMRHHPPAVLQNSGNHFFTGSHHNTLKPSRRGERKTNTERLQSSFANEPCFNL